MLKSSVSFKWVITKTFEKHWRKVLSRLGEYFSLMEETLRSAMVTMPNQSISWALWSLSSVFQFPQTDWKRFSDGKGILRTRGPCSAGDRENFKISKHFDSCRQPREHNVTCLTFYFAFPLFCWSHRSQICLFLNLEIVNKFGWGTNETRFLAKKNKSMVCKKGHRSPVQLTASDLVTHQSIINFVRQVMEETSYFLRRP